MKILIGLGNIGDKYIFTRHNSGFIVLDNLVEDLEKNEDLKIDWKEESKLKAIIAKFKYKNETVLLAKPTTFMNNSGESVVKILNFFKESNDNLIVIYDDIDLMLGHIRFREKGSAGTHNGMKSIIESLGTEEFKRLRIGIESRGEITHKEQDLHSFVLSNFIDIELPLLKKAVLEAVREIKKII